jgi:hypothetical protein
MQVVFDTNAYRQLAAGLPIGEIVELTRKIRAEEELRGIMVFVSPVVWLELFVHLADPTDPHFEECLGALVASYLHSRGKNERNFQLMPWPFMVVADTVFGFKDEARDQEIVSMDALAGLIYGNPTLETLEQYREQVTAFMDYARVQEEAFIQRFNGIQTSFLATFGGEKGLVKAMREPAFVDRLVVFETIRAAEIVNIEVAGMEQAEFDRCTQVVRDYFHAPLFLYIDIMSRMVGSKEFDMSKGSRRNWFWDFEMLFHVSRLTTVYLISNDGDIKHAAEMAGAGDKVAPVERYLEYLKELPVSHVVSITVPAGQEVNVSDMAERLGVSLAEAERMQEELKDAPARLVRDKAGVLAAIQPFYDEVVQRFGAEGNKMMELLDAGKFVYYNKLPLRLLEVAERPDFIFEFEGERVGLEHTQLFDKAEQHRVGKVSSLLEEAKKYMVRMAPDVVGLFSVGIDPERIFLNGRSFMDLPKLDLRTVAEMLGTYVVAYVREEVVERPVFINSIKRYEQGTLSLSPERDFIREGIDRAALEARIAAKEAKIAAYKQSKNLSTCWLLVVYSSAVSSSSFHVRLEDLPYPSGKLQEKNPASH